MGLPAASGRGGARKAFVNAYGQRVSRLKFTSRPHFAQPRWEDEQKALTDWLQQLPRPAGLMACDDCRGREVLEACRTAGIRVPEEMAVIGVDNDELLCELADPPLSSVALNAEAGGYQAAMLLDRMMHGRQCEPARLTVEALHVVTRRSTDIVAIDDPVVAAALRYIHDHAATPIGIGDVVEHVLLSRRAWKCASKPSRAGHRW